MTNQELIAEMRVAASSLNSAAAAIQAGDFSSAEHGVEDTLFRLESVLGRIREAQAVASSAPPPSVPGNGHENH